MIPMTPWVKRLLLANVVMYFVTQSVQPLYFNLAFVPQLILLRPWTIVTYMFLHANFTHILFNMIGLFFFGPRLEERLGGKDFLWLYFLGGIGGALLSVVAHLFSPDNAMIVGASGAVYGVILGFALYWPRERIYIWGVLPVEAWILAAFMVGGSLWAGFTGAQAGVAHFAHLGGLAFGFVFIKWREWSRGAERRAFQKRVNETSSSRVGDRVALSRWESIDVESLHELNRDEVLVLLEKARTLGARSLSLDERQFLDRMSATH